MKSQSEACEFARSYSRENTVGVGAVPASGVSLSTKQVVIADSSRSFVVLSPVLPS